MIDFEKRVQAIVANQRMSIRDLADKLGKAYSTLSKELNPNDGTAKLGLTTALRIMQITGDRRILDLMRQVLDDTPLEIPERYRSHKP